ncbi:MAG: GAF domain-containing sensor histidine kinase [Ardenticatenaceae bacterium]|nr:GAF domain-containing sensor histidine kinase [Anaerolineales bacterium]MCB9006675.1 GAF domain-containing sensor histidine kinase [Ardenticatenaceae bacterium]
MGHRLEGIELLDYVLRVSRDMAEAHSLAPLLAYTIDKVLTLVGAERGYIALKKQDGSIEFSIRRDNKGNDLKGLADEVSYSILQEVVQSGDSVVLSDAMQDPQFGQAKSVMALRLRSIMCVPLITRNQTIGAIYVENRSIRGRFRETDLAPLQLFANQAAIAIENTELIENLKIANDHLTELDELKNNFIILVSHELKTPLTAVSTYAQMMNMIVEKAGLEGDPMLSRTAANLDKATNRMKHVIDEIVQFFRIVSGQLEMVFHEVRLKDVILPIVNGLTAVCQERNLTIQVLDLQTLPLVIADAQRLKVVFQNIIGNAVKYTPDGGQISIQAVCKDDHLLEILVKDTGIGIPKDEQKRVFDMFHVLGSIHTHSTSKSAFRGGGFGLGLPIAKGILEAHKGDIHLESSGFDEALLPGTVCRVTLPYVAEMVPEAA